MCFLKLSKAEWDITSITSNIFHETSPSVFWDYMRPMSTQKILSHLKLISLNLSEKYHLTEHHIFGEIQKGAWNKSILAATVLSTNEEDYDHMAHPDCMWKQY